MKRIRKSRISREPREPRSIGGTHYWITSVANGKPVLIYGSTDYNTAMRKGYEQLDSFFEVVALNTSDIARASRLLKGRKLEQTHDINKSLERLKHKI